VPQRVLTLPIFESVTPSTALELLDQAMVAMLIGCGLRRTQLLDLRRENTTRKDY
jgi:integrase